MTVLYFLSKNPDVIKKSIFGAKFVAMKVGIESSHGLRYKLRMMGVAVSGPRYINGNNMSVIYNTYKP